jgi:electron transport complex protein RnfC
MSQHIGAPCSPLVKVGDAVKLGQKIGDGEGVCSPVHAPVSGTVTAVEQMTVPGGRQCVCVAIENDGKDTPDPSIKPRTTHKGMSAAELADIVREAGICGMGGAAYPTNSKILSTAGKTETLLINACECEPYITSDDTVMCTWPEKVILGARIVADVIGAKHTVIAVEDNKPEAVEALRSKLGGNEDIEVRVLPTRYPQGAKKQLILAVTGREVAPGARTGALFNVTTIYSICRAVYEGLPLTEKVVTVTGEGANEPKNVIVRIGTPLEELLKFAGGMKEETCKVVCGGPMMGTAQGDLSVPVVKGTNAVLCLTDPAPAAENPTCIRCGKCIKACPMGLQPLQLYRYVNAGMKDELERFNLEDCMECGCCSYVCPGRLPLVETFKAGKKLLKEGKRK